MAQAAVPALMLLSTMATVYQVDQSNSAAKQQKRLQEANQKRQDDLLKEASDQKMAERQATEEGRNAASALADKNAARSNQKSKAGLYAGRAGTILTGMESDADTSGANKTLLGA